MILPQTTVKGTSVYEATGAQVSGATEFYLVVRWEFTDVNGSTVERTSLCAVVTGAGPSATPITFEAGKRYTFKLDLDAYSRLIIFNPPTVTEWDKSDPEEEISAGIVKKLTSDQQFWLAAQSVYDTWWNNNNVPLGTAGTGMGYNLTQNPVGFATGCAALGNNKTIGWRVMTKAEYDKYRNDIKAPGFIIGFNGNGDIHLADQSGSGDQNSLWWSCSGWSPTVGSGYPSKQNKRTSFCIRPATPQQ